MANFNVIIEKGEDDYYLSEVVELAGCHTQAKTLDELMKRTKRGNYFMLERKEEDYTVERNFIGIQKIEV